MFFMIALHHLAAQRGDGLRPDLLERLASVEASSASGNVVPIGPRRQGGPTQTGPDPTGAAQPDVLPDNVLSFAEFAKAFKG